MNRVKSFLVLIEAYNYPLKIKPKCLAMVIRHCMALAFISTSSFLFPYCAQFVTHNDLHIFLLKFYFFRKAFPNYLTNNCAWWTSDILDSITILLCILYNTCYVTIFSLFPGLSSVIPDYFLGNRDLACLHDHFTPLDRIVPGTW